MLYFLVEDIKYSRKGRINMLQEEFNDVYSKFKLHFYQNLFEKWKDREASLTTVETFCMEIIHYLGEPTVNEFATMANISSPNAAYKINNLVKKGYIKKKRSTHDRREYHLQVTKKYEKYYEMNYSYVTTVMERVYKRFTPEELEVMEKILNVMSEELMPEIKKTRIPDKYVNANIDDMLKIRRS